MGSHTPGFYMIDRSERTSISYFHIAISELQLTISAQDYLPPMMLLPSGEMVDPNPVRRVPIMPSTLFAYAHMRGRSQHDFDPLHHAMYLASDRYLFPERFLLQYEGPGAIDGLVQ